MFIAKLYACTIYIQQKLYLCIRLTDVTKMFIYYYLLCIWFVEWRKQKLFPLMGWLCIHPWLIEKRKSTLLLSTLKLELSMFFKTSILCKTDCNLKVSCSDIERITKVGSGWQWLIMSYNDLEWDTVTEDELQWLRMSYSDWEVVTMTRSELVT